jgi:hypothetical protein
MNITLEIIYWAAIVAAAGLALWWSKRREPADSEFKRGEADGRNYLDAGVLPTSILGFIETQRSQGMTGPYEMGLKKALQKAKFK